MALKRLLRFLPASSWAACGLLLFLGVSILTTALSYDVGSLRRMGPGYFPLLLGSVLCVLGILVLLEDRVTGRQTQTQDDTVERIAIRPLLLPVLGVLLFALLVRNAGFIPAIIACTFVSAIAHRDNSVHVSILIAVGMAVLGAAVFVYGLGIPVRLFVV